MSDEKRLLSRVVLLAWRGMASFGVVALFAVTGIFTGRFLAGNAQLDDVSLRVAAATFGVSSLLLMIREGLSTLPQLLSYVRTGAGANLYKFATYALITCASLSIALNLVPTEKGEAQPGLPQVLFLQGGRVSQSSQGAPTFLVPFREEAEECAADASCSTGIDLDPAVATYIQLLGQGLSSCGTAVAPVTVSVRGFASSSRFPGRPDSDEVNRQVSNQRARVVSQALEAALDPVGRQHVQITTIVWPTFGQMMQYAGFNDVDSGGAYNVNRGLLNRRAEIRVERSGECDVAYSSFPR